MEETTTTSATKRQRVKRPRPGQMMAAAERLAAATEFATALEAEAFGDVAAYLRAEATK